MSQHPTIGVANDPNPTGRVDILALRLAESYLRRHGDRHTRALFEAVRPLLGELAGDLLGSIDVAPLLERVYAIQAAADRPLFSVDVGGTTP